MDGSRKRVDAEDVQGASTGGKRLRGEWGGARPRSGRESRSSRDVFSRLRELFFAVLGGFRELA